VIHLDTGFLIHPLARGSSADRQLRKGLALGEPIAISTAGWAEFLCGPLPSADLALATRILGEPLPFVAAGAALCADLFNLGGRRRGSLLDCVIAAVAVRADAALATTNPGDFRRFQTAGLRVVAA
jgi:predicted nucleic acid-binding protein